jgi:O-antigen/teichoic acid export membrane protein
MSTLKEKTVKGMAWSAIDNFLSLGLNFVIGIIIARQLSPKEYGLVGMIMIFIAICQVFIASGFGAALIRKKNCTQADYSTVFYYNLAISILLYLVLFFSAGLIADFFSEPLLVPIIRVLGIEIIFDASNIIQKTILTKRVDFKLQTRISVISSVLSGIVGIVMAYSGFGVWSLVVKMVLTSFIPAVLLWIWNAWRPSLVFSIQSFKELFGFGSKLLISGLIDTLYRNVYLVIIGKYFSAESLGYYTRADQFRNFPSHSVSNIIGRVSFPVLSNIQEDKVLLKAAYKRLIKSTMLITFVLMLGMAGLSKSMILVLLGDKWLMTAEYLELLCISGMLYPLQVLNLNMLNVSGRSDLFLRLEIIKKSLAIPTIIIGIVWGIKVMILGMMINAWISYYLNSFWSGKFVNYANKEQLKDIFPSFLLALINGVFVYLIGLFLPFSPIALLAVQLLFGVVFIISVCEYKKIDEYLYIKEILLTQLNTLKKNRKL